MNGSALCRACHRKWEHHVRKEMGFHHTSQCPRDVNGRCLSCTTTDATARPKLRSLLVRDQIRDLVHALFSHLPSNTQGHVANILYRQARTLHRGQDHSFMISIPAVIHFKILSLIAWHHYDSTIRFIQSVPRLDYAASEPWAMECRRELMTVELRAKQPTQSQSQEVVEAAEEFFRGSPNLKALKVQLRSHSGVSAELLHTPDGCRLLYDRLGIRELTLPEPADWSIRHTSEARCKVCQIYEHDSMEVSEGANMGEAVYNCMSCNGWWHESCMTDTDRQTLPPTPIANVEDGGAPPWRCQECVKKDQYAVQRVLEVVRGEDGTFYLLLEYLGYRYLEVRLESWLVDKNSELKKAYREHANTRSSLSLLYCAGAILDAMWHGQSLTELGLETKLVHQDAKLYLLSHTSLQKRGFAPGAASVIQMLVEQEHRLVIPFSLKTPHSTLDGTPMPGSQEGVGNSPNPLKRHSEPSMQAVATRLTALTDAHTSLPMALAQATAGASEWNGLGLLSGSSINDITTALSIFCSHYSAANWGDLLRREIPELTDEDAEWLCSLSEVMESREPASSTANMGQLVPTKACPRVSKRRRSGREGDMASTSQDPHAPSGTALMNAPRAGRKRSTLESSVPVRKSPRLNTEQLAPGRGTDAPPEFGTGSDQVTGQPPSPLAASQRPYRIQLSRAKRTLHGTGPRTGLLYFLQIFTTYLQFLGEHYPAKGQDPVIFFETDDRKPTKGWKAVPSAIDRNQPTTTFLYGSRILMADPLTNRSSGIGPMHGLEP